MSSQKEIKKIKKNKNYEDLVRKCPRSVLANYKKKLKKNKKIKKNNLHIFMFTCITLHKMVSKVKK